MSESGHGGEHAQGRQGRPRVAVQPGAVPPIEETSQHGEVPEGRPGMAGPVQLHGVAVPQQRAVHHARDRSLRVLRPEAERIQHRALPRRGGRGGAAEHGQHLSVPSDLRPLQGAPRDEARPPVRRNPVHGAHPRFVVLRAEGHLRLPQAADAGARRVLHVAGRLRLVPDDHRRRRGGRGPGQLDDREVGQGMLRGSHGGQVPRLRHLGVRRGDREDHADAPGHRRHRAHRRGVLHRRGVHDLHGGPRARVHPVLR